MDFSNEYVSDDQSNANGIMPQCPVVSCENYIVDIIGRISHQGCKLRRQEALRSCKFYKKKSGK
jgi:hypothetical protein